MTFEQKKDLIDSFGFSLTDIQAINNILLSYNLNLEADEKGKELLHKLSISLFNCYDSETDDDKKIISYYYYHITQKELKYLLEESEEETEEEEEEMYNSRDKKEIEKQKGFVDRITNVSTKELTNEIIEFIKTENENLFYQGFDKKIINELAVLYRQKNFITEWHLLPNAIYLKTEKAIDNSKGIIKKEISTYQKNHINIYAENFEKWLSKNQIIKKTKQNFKSFLNQNEIKLDEFLAIKIINYNL